MRSPEEHLSAITALFPARASEDVPVADAAGRVLAQDISAQENSPRFDNSQMDGYALSQEHLQQLPAQLPVGETIPAGTDPDQVYPEGLQREIAPIMTGAKVPKGTAAIVQVEKCQPASFDNGGTVDVPELTAGQFIRKAGSDIAKGSPLLSTGTRITPAAVATLIGQDYSTVPVERKARIIIVTGGAEIGTEGPATIPDANAPMMTALANHYGIEVAGYLSTNDDPEVLREELHGAVGKLAPDAVVTSGGISHGKYEVIRLALDGWFGHVTQQPGGPQGLADVNGTPVLCLPGNPISTLVSFRLFVGPVLGHAPEPVTALLNEPREGLADARDQFLRGKIWVDEDGIVRASGEGGSGSHLIAQAVEANALIRIPAKAKLTAGEPVTAYPLYYA